VVGKVLAKNRYLPALFVSILFNIFVIAYAGHAHLDNAISDEVRS